MTIKETSGRGKPTGATRSIGGSASPRGTGFLWLLAPMVIFLVAPFGLNSYWIFLFATFFAYAIVVMGTRVLFGMSGQLSLAQATFVGIGAYAAAFSSSVWQLTGFYEVLVVIGVSVIASVLVALPALRVSGLRLVLLTLAFGELFQWWLREARESTGGPQGMFVDEFYIPGVDTNSVTFWYWAALGAALLVTILLFRLPNTQLGRQLEAVRSSDLIALSVGVKPRRARLIAFIISGVLAGIGGMFLAHINGMVSPTSYDLFSSVYIVVAVLIGGSRSTVGAWVGAAYLTFVPALFSAFGYDRLYVLLSGLLLVLVIRLLPQGIVSPSRRFKGVKNS